MNGRSQRREPPLSRAGLIVSLLIVLGFAAGVGVILYILGAH